MYLLDEKAIVATIHKEDGPDSPYIKVSIQNTKEQLGMFILSTLQVPLVRFFTHDQDRLLFEIGGMTGRSGEVVREKVKELSQYIQSLNPYEDDCENVRILNYFMAEKYNNLEEAIKIIEAHKIPVKYEFWQ